MSKKIMAMGALGMMLWGTQPALAADPPPLPPMPADVYDNAGVQLNRALEYMEMERVAKQIEEDKAKRSAKVEGTDNPVEVPKEEAYTIRLNGVTTDPSQILSDDEIKVITNEYVGKDVSIKDLYSMVEKINKLYEDKGYVTCQAFLLQQSVENGIIKITLIEGKTGDVDIKGTQWTKDEYIYDRLHLTPGEIANIKTLNRDMLRFNATNDVQLRIVMRAGKENGTTDYSIEAREPKQYSGNVWMDNAGSYSSGELRGGIFVNSRSHSGYRDASTVGVIFSRGMKAFTGGYSVPIGRSGSKFNFQYSSNSVKVVKGDFSAIDNVLGHSNVYSFGVVQPWVINDHTRSDISFTYSYQNSTTDMRKGDWSYTVNDDTINDYTLAFSMTNYGSSHVFYQKHSIVHGNGKRAYNGSDTYLYYRMNGMYQKGYQHGQSLTFRTDFQWTKDNYLPSARQFYIGGMYSVRGYKESYKGADNGISFSAEYAFPLNKERTLSGFCFFDCGHLFGEGAQSAMADMNLASVGVGVKGTFEKNYFVNLTVGRPIKMGFNDLDEPKRVRVNFMLSAAF